MTRHRKQLLKRLDSILTTPTKYFDILFRCFSSVWYVIPLLLLGQLELFFNDLTMKYTPKIRVRCVWLMPIGVSACPMAMAMFSGFYESHEPPPSGDALGIVPPHRNGHQNGKQSRYHCFVCCRPGGCRGDTEWVVAQWRHLVTFMKALIMLHRAMPHAPLQRLRTAIEMACNGCAFVCHCCFFAWRNHS